MSLAKISQGITQFTRDICEDSLNKPLPLYSATGFLDVWDTQPAS
jgi:hypothetical protein